MARLSNPTTQNTHLLGPCFDASVGRVTAACVSCPKELGSLHKLAHAAGHGHFPGPPRQGAPFLLLETVHVANLDTTNSIQQIGDNSPCGLAVLQRVFSDPPGASFGFMTLVLVDEENKLPHTRGWQMFLNARRTNEASFKNNSRPFHIVIHRASNVYRWARTTARSVNPPHAQKGHGTTVACAQPRSRSGVKHVNCDLCGISLLQHVSDKLLSSFQNSASDEMCKRRDHRGCSQLGRKMMLVQGLRNGEVEGEK